MPSPFPGMDPFIESSDRWGDFHLNMISAIRGQLNARLPEGFVAAVGEYVVVQEPDNRGRGRMKEPDVHISRQPESEGAGEGVAVAVEAAPNTILLPEIKPRRHRNVQILDRDWQQVVTVIELLSPANKQAGDDRQAYMRKRNEYRASRLSLVEMDLLRAGRRLPLSTPPPEIRDYYIMVSPYWEHPRAGFWTFGLRDPLPNIPIPLTDEVSAVSLDLRPCVDRVYDESRYANLRYDLPLRPRLNRRDASWVDQVLASRRSMKSPSPEKE